MSTNTSLLINELSPSPWDVDSLFACLQSVERVAVAISGGSDSTALLLLAHDYCQSHGKTLLALTVDHQLRVESKEEAARVGALCQRLSVEHKTLEWLGEKPIAGVSEAARNERYALLAEACDEAGIDHLLVGHTCDDQVETVHMRLKRGGGRGSAGMAEAMLYRTKAGNILNVHRPLLNQRRYDLRMFLAERAVSWIDDPSNDDEHFERIRARRDLANTPHERENLASFARVAGRYRHAISKQASTFIGRSCSFLPLDIVAMPRGAVLDLPHPVRISVMQCLLPYLGGADRRPTVEAIDHFLNAEGSATLSGVLLTRVDGQFYFCREARNLPKPILLGPNPCSWDGRYRLTLTKKNDCHIWVKAACDLSSENHSFEHFSDEAIPRRVQENAIKTQPALCFVPSKGLGKQRIVFPAQNCDTIQISRVLGGVDTFCPSFDWPLRKALETYIYQIGSH